MNIPERAKATDKTLDRFRERPFDWSGAHCIKLARVQAAAFGHNVPPVPMFRSALGAKKALKAQGVSSVTELLDKFLPRHVAPAFMVIGDLCALESSDGLDAVCIADGHGNLFGWHEGKADGLAVIKHAEADIKAAWRL